ncbi:MAG TPA: hypothetical protein VF619_04165 [Allosphingosinicella sp.]|jgi:hypothetical protein
MLSFRPVLPEPVAASLDRVGEALGRPSLDPGTVEAALLALDTLPADFAERARTEIAERCRLRSAPLRLAPVLHLLVGSSPSLTRDHHLRLVERTPGLEYLCLFHWDGFVREAALDRIRGGARSAFFFAAIVHRLNDWVGPVRSAAARCAERVFPKTAAETAAGAAVTLLGRTEQWGRWDGERLILDRAFGREDVARALAQTLRTSVTGPMPRILRHALRRPAMDRHLLDLAREAAIPAVRATALRVLVEGRATWPGGLVRKWIDKSQGLYRHVRTLEERPLERPLPLEALAQIGVADRSAPVRRVAAEALVRHHSSLANAGMLLERLLSDENPAIARRAEFVRTSRAADRDGSASEA